MQCQSCSTVIPDDSIFCEACGAKQSAVESQPPIPHVAQAYHAPATNTFVQSFWRAASLPSKIVFAGGIAILWGFFLTWFDLSAAVGGLASLEGQLNMFEAARQPFGTPTVTVSGFTLAQAWGVIYIYPALAVISCLLLYLAIQKQRNTASLLLVSGWLVLIGSLIGPQSLLVLVFVPAIQKLVGIGMWMNTLGFCAIAVGGLINIRILSQRIS